MAILDILVYPDRRLRCVAQPVTAFNAELKRLVEDMAQTMYSADGIGLAAVQVNVLQRVVVMDLSKTRNCLQTFINPVISNLSGLVESEEGCLSLPEVHETVERAQTVDIEAQDLDGKRFTIAADEMLSICIQHEIDHLDGKVFIDYLSPLKKTRIRNKIKKKSQFIAAAAA